MFQIRKHFRKTMLLLAIGILLCGTYSLSDRLKWIDSLFITGLLFLVVAGAVTVWKGGFFRVFVMGFRRQFGRWENDFPATEDSPDSPRERSRPWIIPAFFTAGLVHILLSILLLLL
ncbi:protein of unknown function [Planifilum fulgidum]|uniref:DUF3899 domain-containing protein n=1 Tax=Planifilum fulgidum TaxID=201973 RepID=A0A1I2NT82_9BACL|nr:DUF3899 domain-containing protein [Planifilum fulgidum]MBO2497785.1 DUF3899 domain-containing protein [Bacillota bacterium]MBO2532946.1 DUF3899 domain-containing protein [Thermoactinomycetaceae bacterium]SFG06793.1 protein of unknown function [Planifilum fulgidum]